jgi:hypothetical protein
MVSKLLGIGSGLLSFVFFSAGVALILSKIRTELFGTLLRELIRSGALEGVDLSATVYKFKGSNPLDFNFHKMIVRHKNDLSDSL